MMVLHNCHARELNHSSVSWSARIAWNIFAVPCGITIAFLMDLYTTMTGIPKTFREFRDEELTNYFICFMSNISKFEF